jgi:hypothetical protein
VGAAFDLWTDDDAPPASGIRLRVPEASPPPAPPAATETEAEVLAEVAEEVFFEVWDLVRALSPLQGAWLRLGLRELGAAALRVGAWRCRGGRRPARRLRERWPELVPGHAAMDRLALVMVDALG